MTKSEKRANRAFCHSSLGLCHSSGVIFPFERALQGFGPAAATMRDLVGAHLRLESPLRLPGLLDFSAILPEAGRQARQVSRAEGGGFDYLGPDDCHPENVRLELRQEVVGGG